MNNVASRALIVLVLVAVLIGGTIFFAVDYGMNGKDWVMTSGSPHIYQKNGVGRGVVTDADDTILLTLNENRTYSSSSVIRKSTLHWVGDRSGNISSAILTQYASEIAGYDPLGGTYRFGDEAGQLKLTLNAQVQAAALEAMGRYKGTIAVYNYETGEIIFAVTTPTYDPDNVPDIAGDTTGAYDGVYVNRFLKSAYTPGSIFKIVTLATALECLPGVESQTFTCTGTVQYGVDKVTCERAHGEQTLKEAFCNSCNCAFGELTLQIGKDRMQRYVQRFGLTESIAFDGLTTTKGNFEVSNAVDQELAWSGIGQYTDLINPCAFVRFVGAIGNGGVLSKPHVVSEITIGKSKTYSAKISEAERIMSTSTAETLAAYMNNNVVNKYGANNFPGLYVCAKSGTGEVGGGKRPNAMFAGFVEDATLPLAFIVCIEDGGYGAQVCIPVLSRVLAACKDNR